MKSLVVFYSRTGNTKKLAKEIAKEFKSDVEEIVDLRKRDGALGFFFGGKDAFTRKLTSIKGMKKDPRLYDVVIIGTPVWANNMSPAVRTYLNNKKDILKNVAFFCSMGSGGDKETFKEMEHLCDEVPASTLSLTTKEVNAKEYKERIPLFIKQIKKELSKKF